MPILINVFDVNLTWGYFYGLGIYWLNEQLPMLAHVPMQYVYWALFQSQEMDKIFCSNR